MPSILSSVLRGVGVDKGSVEQCHERFTFFKTNPFTLQTSQCVNYNVRLARGLLVLFWKSNVVRWLAMSYAEIDLRSVPFS